MFNFDLQIVKKRAKIFLHFGFSCIFVRQAHYPKINSAFLFLSMGLFHHSA